MGADLPPSRTLYNSGSPDQLGLNGTNIGYDMGIFKAHAKKGENEVNEGSEGGQVAQGSLFCDYYDSNAHVKNIHFLWAYTIKSSRYDFTLTSPVSILPQEGKG